jgi:uncharacterized repeat protein (TIGR04076 family)
MLCRSQSRVGSMLEIIVHEIRGSCPVHNVGDEITIDGPNVLVSKTMRYIPMRLQLFSTMLRF